MRFVVTSILFFALSACTVNVTVHDEDRAASLIASFLTDIQSRETISKAYDFTNEQFKAEIDSEQFQNVVTQIRGYNAKATISIEGYETVGTEEVILIHATSQKATQTLYFQFTLLGTKYKDYTLLNMSIQDHAFNTHGLYRDFVETIKIDGV